jgi:chromate reductase, NAD(P)H dehydrogenase (quinone)
MIPLSSLYEVNMQEINILGISGSLRSASVNSGLLRAAQSLLPEGMSLTIAKIEAIPLYNGDLDVSPPPEGVTLFKQKIAAADGLLIATPEYNYSVPGVLKNALDWVSRPLQNSPLNDLPAAIMGAGGKFGTVRAQHHLRQIAVCLNLLVLPTPEVMVQNSWEKFDKLGNLQDEATKEAIRKLLLAFRHWIELLRAK